jgi:hypothetical protein
METDMRTVATALIAAAGVLLSAGPYAQAKPNFSGTWVLDAEKTAAAAAGVTPIAIVMNAATLKITAPSKDGSGTATTYNLDGLGRTTIVMPSRGGQIKEEISTASIEGDKVVIRITGTHGDSVARWYLEGAWLVNERTTRAETVKSFYKKR